MHTYNITTDYRFDFFLLLVCVVVAVFVRYRFNKIIDIAKRTTYSGKKTRILELVGLLIFVSSFIWLFIALLLGMSDVGTDLMPTIVMSAFGWVILFAYSKWVQTHTLLLVAIGAGGLIVAGGWLMISAGSLSRSNPHNFYWIFYPSIAIAISSVLALAAPAFQWFFRMTGVIE